MNGKTNLFVKMQLQTHLPQTCLEQLRHKSRLKHRMIAMCCFQKKLIQLISLFIEKNSTQDLKSLDMIINSMIHKAKGNGYTCKVCWLPKQKKHNIKIHVEAKHVSGFSHPCHQCNDGKRYKTRQSLTGHQFNKHRMCDKKV